MAEEEADLDFNLGLMKKKVRAPSACTLRGPEGSRTALQITS